MNCFHCDITSGVIGVWENARAEACTHCSTSGRQKDMGSEGGGEAGGENALLHAAAPSSSCLRHISNSCPLSLIDVLLHADRGASQPDTLGQQCSAAPRPAISEMWPPGSSTYSLSRLDTASISARTQAGGAM